MTNCTPLIEAVYLSIADEPPDHPTSELRLRCVLADDGEAEGELVAYLSDAVDPLLTTVLIVIAQPPTRLEHRDESGGWHPLALDHLLAATEGASR